MSSVHLVYVITSEKGAVIEIDNKLEVYHSEEEAWKTLIHLKKINLGREFNVRKTRLMLPWV